MKLYIWQFIALACVLHQTSVAYGVQELSKAEIVEHLQIAAASLRSNAEKLNTWSGKYRFEGKTKMEAIPAADGKVIAGPFYRSFEGQLVFSIDLRRNAILSRYSETGTTKFLTKNGKPLNIKTSFKPIECSAIITSEHSLVLYDNISQGKIPGKSLPESLQQGRNIERDTATALDRSQTYSPIIDPRRFFIAPDGILIIVVLDSAIESLESPNSSLVARGFVKQEAGKTLFVFEYEAGPDPLVTSLSFSISDDYNLVSRTESIKDTVVREYTVSYTNSNSIWVPSSFDSEYFDRSGELSLKRSFQLETSDINKSSSKFNLNTLGANPGDRYIDRIEDRVLAVDHDLSLVEPEEFQLQPEPAAGYSWRTILIGLQVVIVVATVVIWSFVRRAHSHR